MPHRGIDTDTTEPERIVTTFTPAHLEDVLAGPRVTTAKTPLNKLFMFQPPPNTAGPVIAPAVTTQAKDATLVFAFMKKGDLAVSLDIPKVATTKTPLNQVFLFQPLPSAVSPNLAPAITTQAKDARLVLAFMKQGDLADSLVEPRVETAKSPLRTLFVPLAGG